MECVNCVKLPLSCPRIREYILRSPKTLRKYQDAELTLRRKCRNNQAPNDVFVYLCIDSALCVYHEASSDSSSIPCCNMGLKRRVSGKGTLAVQREAGRELNIAFPNNKNNPA